MIKGKLTPIRDHVIVEEMNFGEQKTKAGLIILSDDGLFFKLLYIATANSV